MLMQMMLLLWLLLQTVTPGAPVIVTLVEFEGAVELVYHAAQPEYLTVSARSLDDSALDVTLEVLRGTHRLAFNDDHQSDDDTLQSLDAQVRQLHLPHAGAYTLRIHSFSGAQSGHVEVIIQATPLVAPCEIPLQQVTLLQSTAFRCTLDLEAGQRVTLTARDLSSTLDPVLSLWDDTGTRVVFNDDHTTVDTTLDALDARVADFEVSTTGTYTVGVSDFSGRAGIFELRTQIPS